MTNEQTITAIRHALEYCFVSPNEVDRNFEAANIVDGLFAISRSIRCLAEVLNHDKELNEDNSP